MKSAKRSFHPLSASALIVVHCALACAGPPPAQTDEKPAAADCRIAIDVGHTPKAGGTTSARGVGEFEFNQRMARDLLTELRALGMERPFIVNEAADEISLSARTAAASAAGADLFLSIHHDSAQPRYFSTWEHEGESRMYSDVFSGYSLFYSSTGSTPGESLDLARRIGSHLRAAGFEPTLHHAEEIEGENRELVDAERGIYIFSELAVLRTAEMPAVLLECGVIVNRDEEARLNDPGYRRELAATVAAALSETCAEAPRGDRPRG